MAKKAAKKKPAKAKAPARKAKKPKKVSGETPRAKSPPAATKAKPPAEASPATSSRKERLAAAAAAERDRLARYSREKFAAVSDVGEIGEVADPERKERCRLDLYQFLIEYFPGSTGLKEFSDDHRRVIKRIEAVVLEGGRTINAVYRGFAKTTISENTALWATLYGHRKYVPVFSADRTAAEGIIDSLKVELEENDLLFEDFPEVCVPVRALEGKPQRCNSQTFGGELTHIEWTANRIVLPTIEGSAASGAILVAKGLTSSARGMKHKRPDGTQQRPDFVIIDDPQTDQSASSEKQIQRRLGIIKKTILKLAGHRSTIAVVMNATVIEEGDLVDQLIDHTLNPSWQAERIKFVHRWSDHHEWWLKDYAAARNNYDPELPDDQDRAKREATELYLANRGMADAGCEISWEHCYDPETEVSAIQHAYNHLIDDGEDVFASEFQQEPRKKATETLRLPAEQLARKISSYGRLAFPPECHTLTAMIDVHQELLYFVVTAWSDGFTGYVIDYGSWPDQGLAYYTMASARRTLSKAFSGKGPEACVYAGLEQLSEQILGRTYERSDGEEMQVKRSLVDSSWGQTTELVKSFCRDSKHRHLLIPSHGKYYGASTEPINSTKKPKKGERRGYQWFMPPPERGRKQHVVYDANFWKTFLHQRFATSQGDAGCLVLFTASAHEHRLFADHCHAETPIRTQGRGRECDEWKTNPGRPDNHLFDCVVGTCVAASIEGVTLKEIRQVAARPQRRPKKRVSYL